MFYRNYQKKNKYNAKKTIYKGFKYDSKLEVSKAIELDSLLKQQKIKGYDKQFKISLDVAGSHICNYFVDFRVHLNDNSFELIEIKSPVTCTPIWRLKVKLMEATFLKENLDHRYVVEVNGGNYNKKWLKKYKKSNIKLSIDK